VPNSRGRTPNPKAVKPGKEITRAEDGRPRSSAELQQIAQKYERMIQASPDAITLRSLPSRRYVEVNEGFERLTGFTSQEVIGKTPVELGIWVEGDDRAQTLNKLEREGQVYEEEFRFRTKAGEIRYGQLSAVRLVLNGEPFMLSITHDITNLKKAEEEVRRSEADFRSLMQDAPYGIYRVTEEGRLLHVNPALVRMLGYTSEADLLQRNVTEIYRDPRVRARLIHNEDFRGAEAEWKRKDGQTITVHLTARAVSKNGSVAYFEVFAEDITERRSLERQLLQSQKMDAIGRLAGGIAHDFNNLLGVILGHSEIMEEQMGHDRKMRKSAEAIRSAAERAAALTMQLLAFSRKQIVEPKVIDLNAALKEMQKLVRRVVDEDIEVVLKLDRALGHVRIDPGQFDQIIMNLVVNARDAMPDGGKLILQTANFELDEMYVKQHLGAKPGSYVMFSVSDTGTGMDEATLSHIFEPFFTTKETGKGTGLGLSTVYGIVKQANGYLMAYSEPGHGTIMKIFLPRAHKDSLVDEPVAAAKAIPRGTETILLVEDETALRELTRSILEDSGYKVLEARNSEEATEMARDTQSKIDLLLTDVVMPGVSGNELAKRLSAVRSDLKVLYMSGYTDDVVAHKGVLAEGTVLIQKPFTKKGLLSKVRQSLDERS
jgi:two-component system, cell cycle sensor histidine kinase and response regulator CckA